MHVYVFCARFVWLIEPTSGNYPLHLQMVVILQPASCLPVTIFTAMTNNCQQDGCKSSLVNRVTSCLFSFVVEFANGFKGTVSLAR